MKTLYYFEIKFTFEYVLVPSTVAKVLFKSQLRGKDHSYLVTK